MDLLIIFINAMLINNFVLSRFLGICSFLGVSKKRDASIGMGLAVLFVMVIASLGTWSVYTFLLEPYDLDYLKTVAFILVIAALVQFVEMVIKKISPAIAKTSTTSMIVKPGLCGRGFCLLVFRRSWLKLFMLIMVNILPPHPPDVKGVLTF